MTIIPVLPDVHFSYYAIYVNGNAQASSPLPRRINCRMNNNLQAPFPYFGGKSSIAHIVWQALGQPRHYIEPFFGSGAVLLARPDWQPTMTETVNDKDGFLANVWRALQAAPDEVARWCDWPVNHADLCARRKVLLKNEKLLLENLIKDDSFYDAKLAGYWIWAASCWIGAGLTRPNAMPHINNKGCGIHKVGERPHIMQKGKGVHKTGGRENSKSVDVKAPYNLNIYSWFRVLSERLRYVRVVCGDWSRVCGGNWQANLGICGMFLDPPYSDPNRDNDIYHQESMTVAQDVSSWALSRADNPLYRIVIAGYYEEHKELLKHSWTCHRWKTSGGYGNQKTKNKETKNMNRFREALFFSPHCLNLKKQNELF